MLRAPTTALAPSGGIAASPARARVAARGKTAAARGAVPVGAADARARDGSTSNTFKMMFASASRLRARAPSRGAVRVSASASASAPAAGAPGDSPDSESADSGDPYLTSKRLYPHLELDFKPRLSIPALVSAVVSSWAAVVAYAVFFSKFHLRHYTLSLKALYLEIFSFAIVGAGAFWVVKTLLAEAQEQARLVPASAAADPDSKFASVDGLDVHYKLSEWDSDSSVSTSESDSKQNQDPKPRIVVSCVHGFGANTYSWERATLQPLAEKLRATAVAHDAPGFGLTERVGDLKRYTPRTNAAIARAMLDLAEGTLNEEDGSKKEKTWNDVVHEMSSDEASATKTAKEKKKSRARRVVVGHSMGGVAAAIAAAEGDIDDVVLVAPAVIAASARAAGDLPETRKEKEKNPLSLLLGACARAFRVVVAFAASPVVLFAVRKLVRSASFWRDGLGKAVGAAARARMRTDATWADGYRRPSAVTGWDAGMVRVVLAAATGGVSLARAVLGATSPTAEADKPENIIEALRLSKARVLIVHGSDDMIVPVGNSRRLAELIPRAEMVEMPGVGHMPHEEAPEAFLDAVTAFVDER